MSDFDPPPPGTTETRVTYDPVAATTTEVTRQTGPLAPRSGSAAWWGAGLVAVVAILAAAFVLTRQSTPAVSPDQVAADATAQTRAQDAAQQVQDAAAQMQANTQAQANAQASTQAAQA
ncbi:MAG: hypothetical protein ACR2FH_11430, partial [Caulobacteraceae bacterium]